MEVPRDQGGVKASMQNRMEMEMPMPMMKVSGKELARDFPVSPSDRVYPDLSYHRTTHDIDIPDERSDLQR